MKSYSIKEKLYSGGISLGTFVMEFNTPGIACILEKTDIDFIVYDMEHSGFGTDSVRNLMSYNRGIDVIPIVRIPDNQYNFIARTLDAGAKGIMAPLVNNGEQAKKIVDSCKYPPVGKRGAGFNAAHDNFTGGDIVEKIKKSNEDFLVIVQIETEEAVQNIEEIISTEGVDIAWVGHVDLSVSMGIPGQVNHPNMIEAMERVAKACAQYGKTAGRLVPDVECARIWIDKGYRCLAYSNDKVLLQNAVKSGISQIKSYIHSK